ncbi:YdcF family protein [Ornithinibacillus sp. 4-3]|uniref:YdcF family protein n=1 Tax=Ornithinibacillus sp. 4-3 TaxID=3231488 RepID=A0AB39HJE0_9BACI
MDYFLILLSIFLLSAILGITWFILQYRKEKRSLWLGISFLFALITVLANISFPLIRISDIGFIRVMLIGGALLVGIVILLFPLVLILSMLISGIRLMRREGITLSHMLSFGFGIAYILYLIIWPLLEGTFKSTFFDFLYTYLSFVFFFTLFIFVLYTVTNMLNLLKHFRKKYQYIIVLGSGLRNGKEVTPLLANRVDKGIQAYRENPGSILVLSGGRGADEKIAEGEAMKQYALQQGVPASDILVEDKSVNTRENLLFSQQLIRRHMTINEPNLLVVTTRYHVLRALLLAKNLGIACDGRGSRTKLYFSINAFIREWIAYLVLWKKPYIIILIGAFIVIALLYGLQALLGI